MIKVREAVEADVAGIREIFEESYRGQYTHPEFCELEGLKRIVFDEDMLVLVAEDTATGRVFGTASVILDIGAFGDLSGEFGRLAVHPDGRKRGIGKLLMEARLERVAERLHIGIVDNRAVHPFSQRISAKNGFKAVGFLPSKMKFAEREHIAPYARPFGACLELRKNHPHVIPEAYALADHVLKEFGVADDVIVDDDTPAYHSADPFDLEAMTSAGYTALLRFERGRVGTREIFGPVKLHAGMFKLRVSHYRYLLARRDGRLAGGIGFHIDPTEEAARILELVSADDLPIRFLLEETVRVCRDEGGVKYIEVDVNGHAPAMQRTLLEMGFLPAAYVPALCFHRVERFDVIRMVKLFTPLEMRGVELHETTQEAADIVIRAFRNREVVPRIAAAVPGSALFDGLSVEQAQRLASICTLSTYKPGESLAKRGVVDGRAFLLLSGGVEALMGNGVLETVGNIVAGETAGELSLLARDHPHAVTLTATSAVEAAVFDSGEVDRLVRRRPDIGLVIYRNLARQLGTKLLRADRELADSAVGV